MMFIRKGVDALNRYSLGFAAIVMLMGTTLSSAQIAAGPRITVAEMQHDFGTVVQGTQVEHIFELKNAGTEQLIIERVQSS